MYLCSYLGNLTEFICFNNEYIFWVKKVRIMSTCKISPEKIESLLSKLRHHMLTTDEAREFLPILENEAKIAKEGDKREYEKVVIRLAKLLRMHLNDTIDLNKINFDVLNELDTVKLS